MRERPGALQRLILSPEISVLVALTAAALMLLGGCSWIVPVVTFVFTLVLCQIVHGELLFRGECFPLIGVAMLAQAAFPADITGLVMCAVVLLAYGTFTLCYNHTEITRTVFLLFLLCGCGLLWQRSFVFLATIILVMTILLRIFSMRGLVAALLGLITPAILFLPFRVEYAQALWAEYSQPLVMGYSTDLIVVGALDILTGLMTFLPAYGYPAKNRARNMALLAMGLCAVIAAVVDFANVSAYSLIICLCCGYNVAHFASLKRHNWLLVILAWIILLVK